MRRSWLIGVVPLAVAAACSSRVPDVYALAVDAKYLYLGAANGLGVWAIDRTTREASWIANSSAWAMAIDDDGLHWGEHTKPGAGAFNVYRTR